MAGGGGKSATRPRAGEGTAWSRCEDRDRPRRRLQENGDSAGSWGANQVGQWMYDGTVYGDERYYALAPETADTDLPIEIHMPGGASRHHEEGDPPTRSGIQPVSPS